VYHEPAWEGLRMICLLDILLVDGVRYVEGVREVMVL
jgi:hypothetical protein